MTTAALHLASLLTRCHANYVETFRALARLVDGGVIEEHDGLVLVASGAPIAAFNPAFVIRPVADPAAALERARHFFAGYALPWVLRAVGDSGTGLGPAIMSTGLALSPPLPGMLLAPLSGEVPEVPGLEVRVVEDAAGLRAYTKVMAAGFEMPHAALAALESPRMLNVPDMRLYLGVIDGVPVATALRASSHRIAGVFNIATIPAYRRRGLGAAMTMRAALDGCDEGCLGSYLQASPMGFPLYAGLGYQHVADYPSWHNPPR